MISFFTSSNNSLFEVINCILSVCFPPVKLLDGILMVKLGVGFYLYVPYPPTIDIRS